MSKSPPVYEKARWIAGRLAQAKAVLMVGGCVRDRLLGLPVKDIDLEVYGLSYDEILKALKDSGLKLNLVGRQFAVIKVDQDIDISIPRRESKYGIGHRSFLVEADERMTYPEAALRRDFTINAIAENFEGGVIDPHGGRADLRAGLLRAVGPGFGEDPLRVLRAIQFAGRFNLRLEAKTRDLCRALKAEYVSLPGDRIWQEWKKWSDHSVYPSAGLKVLHETGWVEFYPEIANLLGVEQDPEWHPEGDVWAHTLHVCDAAAKIAEREELTPEQRSVLLLSALTHDFGKVSTTFRNPKGRWISPNHAEAGVPLAESFLERIHAPHLWREQVPPLVAEHMVHISLKDELPSARAVRRLAMRLHPASLRQLERLTEADHSGRPPLPSGRPMASWLKVAEELALQDDRPQPLVLGRHLLQCGLKAGPKMGRVLRIAFEAQLDGAFATAEEGLDWLKERGLILN